MNQLTQPSTWAGLASLASIAMQFVPPQYQWIAAAIGGAAGAAAVKLNEKTAP